MILKGYILVKIYKFWTKSINLLKKLIKNFFFIKKFKFSINL